jgi:FkbM family methyltransferase
MIACILLVKSFDCLKACHPPGTPRPNRKSRMTQLSTPTTFTSYAQNFEDVMLWRALKHVSCGTYVDIGAQHPVVDSVSRAFYEQGWRGIHVEPVSHYAELLRQDRPDETVLQLALSDRTGMLELHVIADTGLSTGVKVHAASHLAERGFKHQVVLTPMLPMKTALASLNDTPVHWLKIDVEGLEEQVLRGWDSTTLRPWIIVIEATTPSSQELSYEGADRILIDARYKFAYFDGLNRFYVAAEHAELMASLTVPPNVFDGARLSGTSSSSWCTDLVSLHRAERQEDAKKIDAIRMDWARAESAAHARLEEEKSRTTREMTRAQAAEARAIAAEAHARRAHERADLAETHALFASRTPIKRLTSALAERRFKSGIKRRVKSLIRVTAITVNQNPTLKRVAVSLLSRVPRVKRRLQTMLAPPPVVVEAISHEKPLPMSHDTNLIYRQLRQGMQKGRKLPCES